MRELNLTFHFTHVPPIMRRGNHALIVVENSQGKLLLGSKAIYPPGIYRFVGGGIEPKENPHLAAQRELEEELGIHISQDRLIPLARVTATVFDPKQTWVFMTYLYYTKLTNDTVKPSSDLDGVVVLSHDEVRALVDRYKQLPDDLIRIGSDSSGLFRWSDYGAFYGEIHAFALTLLKEREGSPGVGH